MGDGLAFSLRKMLRRGPGPPRRESVTIDRAKMKEAKAKKDRKNDKSREKAEKREKHGGAKASREEELLPAAEVAMGAAEDGPRSAAAGGGGRWIHMPG